MIILVHASPQTLEPFRCPQLGVLSSPRRFYLTEIETWPWAADNDAFSQWDAERYRKMLDGIQGLQGCLFVTAPDVVGNAERTLALFEDWYERVRACGQPVALVAQDGLTAERMPWAEIDALFLGGSDHFKMGDGAREITAEAKRRGLWIHMGRVNSHRRLMYAKAIGCDSIDGSSLTWFKDRWLPQFLQHAAEPAQTLLG